MVPHQKSSGSNSSEELAPDMALKVAFSDISVLITFASESLRISSVVSLLFVLIFLVIQVG
jgi:hypothetical protein